MSKKITRKMPEFLMNLDTSTLEKFQESADIDMFVLCYGHHTVHFHYRNKKLLWEPGVYDGFADERVLSLVWDSRQDNFISELVYFEDDGTCWNTKLTAEFASKPHASYDRSRGGFLPAEWETPACKSIKLNDWIVTEKYINYDSTIQSKQEIASLVKALNPHVQSWLMLNGYDYCKYLMAPYLEILEKMKDNFIDLHHKAIDKSEKLREQSGLPPLSKIGHFNRLYDNAPVKEASYIKIKEMTKEEYREEDINKTFESNDAIYLKGEFTGSLQLLGETRIVVATIDETNCAVSMDVTNKMFCPDSEARNELKAKEDTLDLVTEKEQDLLRYDALTAYAATFDDRKSGNKAAIKWLDVAKDIIATDNYVSYIDESKECGFKDRRTGVELKFTNCEPAVEMTDRCVTMKRFAKDILKEELRSICQKHYISERSIKEIAELADHADTAEKNILARIDKTNCIRSINEDLKLLEGGLSVEDTILRIDKRCEVVDDMKMLIGNFDKARAISDNLKREMEKYKALAKTDPILALCKTLEPDCEREGEYITMHLEDGTDFAISQKDGRLAERCNQLDDRIMELQKAFIDTIKDARDQGADLLDIPGESHNIEEQEIDQDEIER